MMNCPHMHNKCPLYFILQDPYILIYPTNFPPFHLSSGIALRIIWAICASNSLGIDNFTPKNSIQNQKFFFLPIHSRCCALQQSYQTQIKCGSFHILTLTEKYEWASQLSQAFPQSRILKPVDEITIFPVLHFLNSFFIFSRFILLRFLSFSLCFPYSVYSNFLVSFFFSAK